MASFFIQIGTNLVNDAMDFKKGADTEMRIGPQRITQAKKISPQFVLNLATVFFLMAIAFGIPLVKHGGSPIIVIGLLSVLCGYAYTSGPFPLAYVGLGDLFVVIFFGIVAVMGLFFLQTGEWTVPAFVAGLQVGFHATVLIAINNLRDMHGDKLVNKKTLAVRMGESFSKLEIGLLIFSPYVLNIYWIRQGYLIAGFLPILSLILAIPLFRKVLKTPPSEVYNVYLAKAAGLHLVFGLLLTIGLFLSNR
jgi:1,4-dihydroxy-2-naphthoate octaprenyltransferase